MRTLTPRRWLTIAGTCAVLFFLLGAPEITNNEGSLAAFGAWSQLILGLVGIVALALASWGLFARRTHKH